MKSLITGMTSESGKGRIPYEFEIVNLCRATGWSYWELVTQPTWFVERFKLYMQAESTAEQIRSAKQSAKAPGKFNRPIVPRRYKG